MKHGAKVKRCSREGCTNKAVKGGVCKKHGVAMMDVQNELKMEECVLRTEQRSNYAAVKDVRSKPKKKECVLRTEQRSHPKDAAKKDAQI